LQSEPFLERETNIVVSVVKRIGFDTFAFRMQTYGGISKVFQEVINGLNQLPNSSRIESVVTEHIPEFWQNRLHAGSIALDTSKNRIINAGLRRLPRSKSKSIDLWHLSYYHKAPLVFPGTPFAITVHDFTPEIYPELMNQPNAHLQKMQLIKKADLIFCVSETTKKNLLELFPRINEKKIKTVYPGPSIEKSEKKVAGSRPYFLIVGRPDGYKNLKLILQTMAWFPDFDYVFFGMSRSELPTEYLLSNGPQIFCTAGDTDLLAMYYRGAQAYITSSLSEGFCIPVLDALISGCPAIVSDLEVFHEVYGNSIAYFDPMSVESLVESMRGIRTMKLQTFDSQKYTWEKLVDTHVDSYFEVLG
jgi:glycosyltransferase involved in cell wall biosynthesis